MDKILGVSFDFWNTLAVPSKRYAEARSQYFYDNFNLTKEDYKNAKKFFDYWAEKAGIASTPLMSLAYLFRDKLDLEEDFNLERVYTDITELFLQYPPTIPNEVKQALEILHANNVMWTITSNTNFIGGNILAGFLSTELEPHLFDNANKFNFSDIIGVSKPHDHIFNHAFYYMSTEYFRLNQVAPKPIDYIHIGDNFECDYKGAVKFGMRGAHITDPSMVLNVVKELKL